MCILLGKTNRNALRKPVLWRRYRKKHCFSGTQSRNSRQNSLPLFGRRSWNQVNL